VCVEGWDFAGSLIKYAVGVHAAAEMLNRENSREKRELEKSLNTSYHPFTSSLSALLFIVALAN